MNSIIYITDIHVPCLYTAKSKQPIQETSECIYCKTPMPKRHKNENRMNAAGSGQIRFVASFRLSTRSNKLYPHSAYWPDRRGSVDPQRQVMSEGNSQRHTYNRCLQKLKIIGPNRRTAEGTNACANEAPDPHLSVLQTSAPRPWPGAYWPRAAGTREPCNSNVEVEAESLYSAKSERVINQSLTPRTLNGFVPADIRPCPICKSH